LFFAIQVLKIITLLLKVGNMVLDLALNIHPESCRLVLVRLYFLIKNKKIQQTFI